MNIFNRVAMILLLMVLIVILAIIVISTMFFPVQAVEWVRQGADILEANLMLTNRLIVFVVGALVLIFCMLLLWLEIRRGRARTIRVRRISGGEAQLAVESIARRVEYNIGQLADITKVRPTVIRRGKGVEVHLDLETSPDIEVPMKTEEVCVVTREVVEDQMGLKLNNVKVNIKHAPFPKDKKKPWDWQRRELPRPVDLPVGEPEEMVPVYTSPAARVEEAAPPPAPPEEEPEEIIEGEVEEAPPLPHIPEERLEEPAEIEEAPPAPPVLEERAEEEWEEMIRAGMEEAPPPPPIPEERAEEEKPSLSPFARLKGLFIKETPAPAPEEEWFEPVPPYEEAEVEEAILTPPPPVPEVEVEEAIPPAYPPLEELVEETMPYGLEVEREFAEEEVITPLEEAEEAFPVEEEEEMAPSLALEEEAEAEYPPYPGEMVEVEEEEEMAPSLALEEEAEAEYPPAPDEMVEAEEEEEMAPSLALEEEAEAEYPPYPDETVEAEEEEEIAPSLTLEEEAEYPPAPDETVEVEEEEERAPSSTLKEDLEREEPWH